MTRISVVGLGKLGACIAACFAHKGFTVVGLDVNPRTVELVNRNEPPVLEPGLAELMHQAQGRLRATADYREAVQATDVTFIMVPTPSEANGRFSLKYAKEAAQALGEALADKAEYHLVVLTSTVLPGSTEFGILPILEAASGKRCRQDFGLCYSPQFIALGSVIRDFLYPDLVLVGESDPQAGEQLAGLYKQVCSNDPAVARMSWANAELAKISVNTYVTMKITFANMLAALCEQLPGGDVDVVTAAIGLDTRIGTRYLKGAVGYGGPCFPRDNLALAYLARELGQPATLAEATDAYNRTIVGRLTNKVRSYVPPGGRVAILGLAYKPDTNVIDEAQGLKLAEALVEAGYRVVVYDPIALDSAHRVLGERVSYASSLDEVTRGADMVVIANPDPSFRELKLEAAPGGARPVVLDAWRLLRRELESDAGLAYLPVGLAGSGEHLAASLAALWS